MKKMLLAGLLLVGVVGAGWLVAGSLDAAEAQAPPARCICSETTKIGAEGLTHCLCGKLECVLATSVQDAIQLRCR